MTLNAIALVTLNQAKAHLRVDTAASLRVPAEYVGVGTGSATTFSLDNTPIVGSVKLYVNGTLQVEGSENDYTISGANITFVTVPPSGHQITANYDKEASANTFESYDDELLENLINAATKKAEDHTGRAFIRRAITETHIGDNRQMLRLYKQPVVAGSITAISVGGNALSSWTERLTIGRIYHLVVWPLDSEIIIAYTAGYAATRAATQALVPDAVTSVLMMVAYLYENKTDMVHSESTTGVGSVTYELPLYIERSGAKQYLDSLRVNLI